MNNKIDDCSTLDHFDSQQGNTWMKTIPKKGTFLRVHEAEC